MVYVTLSLFVLLVCSNIDDFNIRNLLLTAKLLKQGYRYHKIRKSIYYILPQTLRVNCKIQHWVKNSSATRHIRTYVLWSFS